MRLTLLSIEKQISDATEFVRLSSLQGRIKILASNEVAAAATEMTHHTIKLFRETEESKEKAQNIESGEAGKSPLQFIEIAKKELDELKKNV